MRALRSGQSTSSRCSARPRDAVDTPTGIVTDPGGPMARIVLRLTGNSAALVDGSRSLHQPLPSIQGFVFSPANARWLACRKANRQGLRRNAPEIDLHTVTPWSISIRTEGQPNLSRESRRDRRIFA